MPENEIQIQVRPGGMLSDIVETELAAYQHQDVVNLKQNKIGEWESVKGYIDLFENGSYTNIKAAIEIDDDLSGDRFILFQNGTNIYRIDYDDGDGNGYENEAPTLLLESGVTISGVTIGASAVLRFFVYRGIVRITGASEPLWYGYIDRTIFENAWREIELHDFGTTESYVESDTTISVYDADADADGTGMWGAPEGSTCLKVAQTANNGYAYKAITVTSGEDYRLTTFMFAPTGITGNCTINVGTTQGGSEYGSVINSDNDVWEFNDITFTATGATVYISVISSDGAANDTAYFDFFLLEEKSDIVIQDWFLKKAQLEAVQLNTLAGGNIQIIDSDDTYALFYKCFTQYDSSQYSLLSDMSNGGEDEHILKPNIVVKDGYSPVAQVHIELPGTNLRTTLNERLTGIGMCFAIYAVDSTPVDDNIVYYVEDLVDLTDSEEIFQDFQTYYYITTYKNRFYLNPTDIQVQKVSAYFFNIGQRIEITNDGGDVFDTVITAKYSSGGTHYVEIGMPIATDLKDVDSTGNFDIKVKLYREWQYDASSGYDTYLGANFANWSTNEFHDYIGIPAGTTDINPNYSHIEVIEERAYCKSDELDEQDIVRYSPLYQFDSFPNGSLIQTEIGDSDNNKAIAKRGNRLVMLKRKSFSQGNFVGTSYAEDIGIARKGLYPTTYGFIVVDDILYFMDEDDVYVWNGAQIQGLLSGSLLQNYYKDNVSTSSFFLYRKKENELWMWLASGVILVWDMKRNQFYRRDTDITPIGYFLDTENNLIAFNAAKFVKYDHSETTFSETIGYEIDTKIYDLKIPEKFKKLKKIDLVGKSNAVLKWTASDDTLSGETSTGTITLDSSNMVDKYDLPKYLFKQLNFLVEDNAEASNLTLNLREIKLTVKI